MKNLKKRMAAFMIACTMAVTAFVGSADISSVEAAPKNGAYNKLLGCDVSQFNGNINFGQMKAAGASFVIIRVGARNTVTGALTEDKYYARNIQNALNAGLRVGVYVFSQAITPQEAIEEADFLVSRIYKYNITLPVVIDYEYKNGTGRLHDANLSRETATSVVNTFCDRVEASGYTGMVYANRNMLLGKLNAGAITGSHRVWLAHYTDATNYTGYFDFWQYTSRASGPQYGCSSSYVDMDYWFDDGTIYGGDYSAVFDPNYYKNAYADAAAACGGNVSALLQHFINTGMKEGRRGNATFNPVSYRNQYPEIRAQYGLDWSKYYEHYMSTGRREGRQGTGYEDNMVGGLTVFDGLDYAAVYNPGYYAAHNPDLVRAFGYDEGKLLAHFVNSGMAEGRQGSASFKAANYKANYPDLAESFQDAWAMYYLHYVKHGASEGRRGI